MRILFFEMLKQKLRASMVIMVCAFIIAMLTGGCAGGHKKETSLVTPAPPSPAEVSVSHANETGQVSEKGEPVNSETNDDQELECRKYAVGGSNIKRKVCATKEQWAIRDNRNSKDKDKFLYDANEASRVNTVDPTPEPPPPGIEAFMNMGR